jgi:signal transduction histidine kinase
MTGGFPGVASRVYRPPLVLAGTAMRARTAAGDGPAVATFAVVGAAVVTVVRCLVIAYVVLQVAIWHSFYTAVPWRLAGPAAAVACAAAAVTGLRRGLPARWLALGDVPVHLALALSAVLFLPPLMRGDTANWLYLALLDTLVLPALFTSARLTVALAAAAAAAFWGGDLLSRPEGGNSPLAAAGFLLALAAAMCWGRYALYRRAAAADAALGQADREAREQYVARSRGAERREHERLLHDTVLNTLTALARPDAGGGGAVGRCRHDVALMEQALSDAADVARPGAAGLLAGLTGAAAEMAGRGLDVTVTSGPPTAGGGPVPPEVSTAVTHAVREALANVAQHAGTSRATVEVRLGDGLEVLVRDAGAGFDPARVGPSRLGVRRSIGERLADVGGVASVRSAPGAGTVVSLRWPRDAGPGPGGPDPAGLGGG